MTIAFGRRRLIVSLIAAPPRKVLHIPLAENASDDELARLNGLLAAGEDRRRWEADAVLYGGLRPR